MIHAEQFIKFYLSLLFHLKIVALLFTSPLAGEVEVYSPRERDIPKILKLPFNNENNPTIIL